MRVAALLLTSFAYAILGRRIITRQQLPQRELNGSVLNQLHTFKMFLLACIPGCSFNPSVRRADFSGTTATRVCLQQAVWDDRPGIRRLPAMRMLTLQEDSLQSLTVNDLKAKLKASGLKISGKKAELIERLEEHATELQSSESEKEEDLSNTALKKERENTDQDFTSATTSIREGLGAVMARHIASHGTKSSTLISFYRFLDIAEPGKLADQFRSTIEQMDPSIAAEKTHKHLRRELIRLDASSAIRGTLYVAEEGINGQFMVPTLRLQDFHSALVSVRGMQGRIADLDFNIGGCVTGEEVARDPPFRKLQVKSRAQILTDGFARSSEISSSTSHASIDCSDAGPELTPEMWHQEVEKDVPADRAILLDIRNGVETKVGTFKGARPLNTEQFSDSWEKLDEMLHGVDKDKRILTFCTGGIRCVKVNSYLKNKGYDNVGRLQKGIIGYERWVQDQGSDVQTLFEGDNFVFDRRRMERQVAVEPRKKTREVSVSAEVVENSQNTAAPGGSTGLNLAVLKPLEAPPALNSPVYSLATRCADGGTNMNILTYATPVGIAPRLWAISLFRKTLSHANFKRERTAVLQLLCRPHASLVYTLGGQSGRDVDKAGECAKAGFTWLKTDGELLLPGCATYLRLHQVGEFLDAGEHDLALCRVEAFADPSGPPPEAALSSAVLRALGLITDKGRAVEPQNE